MLFEGGPKLEDSEYKELEYKRSLKKTYLGMEQLKDLMDLALDTKDESWMKAIYVKMKAKKDIITNRK